MDFEITYDPEMKCVVGKLNGIMDTQTVRIYVKEISAVAKKHNCKKFINDLREAEIKLSITDLYNAPKEVTTDEFDRTWKRAIVVKERTDSISFFETTSRNQGFQVKIFDNIEEALEWLC